MSADDLDPLADATNNYPSYLETLQSAGSVTRPYWWCRTCSTPALAQ